MKHLFTDDNIQLLPDYITSLLRISQPAFNGLR